MPKGKDIYLDLSKKWIKRRRARAGKLHKGTVPTVDGYQNVPIFAKSLNQHPDEKTKPRQVSPNEGKPAVNMSAKTEGLIHKPRKPKVLDPTSGAIKPEDLGKTPKKRGRPRKNKEATDVKSKTSKAPRRRNKKTEESGEVSS